MAQLAECLSNMLEATGLAPSSLMWYLIITYCACVTAHYLMYTPYSHTMLLPVPGPPVPSADLSVEAGCCRHGLPCGASVRILGIGTRVLMRAQQSFTHRAMSQESFVTLKEKAVFTTEACAISHGCPSCEGEIVVSEGAAGLQGFRRLTQCEVLTSRLPQPQVGR